MVALSCGYTFTSCWQPLILELFHGANPPQTICKNARWSEVTFHKVDWSAMQSCMSRFSKVQQIAYGKLLHGLLNTNVQNNKFYNQSSLCPVCLAEPESFLHAVTCTHPETVQHRSTQQLSLWKALTGIQTPPAVLAAIRSVIIDEVCDNDSTLNYTASVHSSTSSRSAPSAFESMIQAAVSQQITDLGREHFYRGRVSLLWKEAAYLESLHLGIGLNKQRWAAGAVSALLRYRHALWYFRCKVVHGHSQSEVNQCRLESLHLQVAKAYEAFSADPFIVTGRIRHIFYTPLSDRLQQDVDSLQCFLATYQLAIQEQAVYRVRHAQAAVTFFFPRSLPTLLEWSDLDECSSLASNSLDRTLEPTDSPSSVTLSVSSDVTRGVSPGSSELSSTGYLSGFCMEHIGSGLSVSGCCTFPSSL